MYRFTHTFIKTLSMNHSAVNDLLVDIESILTRIRSRAPTRDPRMPEEMMVLFQNKIDLLFQVNHIYHDKDLTVAKLATLLGTNTSYLSIFFNQHYGKSFRTFLNELRIRETKELLLNSDFDYLTFDAIGLTAGFNSKSSFFRAFRNITGISPKEFRDMYRK